MDYDLHSGTLWNGGSSTHLAALVISWVCYASNCLTCLAEPQGGIDPGGLENPMTAAVRELREETGITSARLVALVSVSFHAPFHSRGARPLPTRARPA